MLRGTLPLLDSKEYPPLVLGAGGIILFGLNEERETVTSSIPSLVGALAELRDPLVSRARTGFGGTLSDVLSNFSVGITFGAN